MSPSPRLRPYAPAVVFSALGVFFFATGPRGVAPPPDATRLETAHTEVVDSQLVAVLIGASFCGACRSDRFQDAFTSLQEYLPSLDSTVVFVAALLDDDLEEGLDFSRTLGDFDEIMLGGNWRNHGALKYMWGDLPGPGSIPQLVVLRRSIISTDESVSVATEGVLRRLVGVDEIERWTDALARGSVTSN